MCPQNPTKTSTSVILATISKDHMSMQESQEEQIGHGETTEVLSAFAHTQKPVWKGGTKGPLEENT